ncbi:MAG: 6-bladed beta-propeller [Bacteroidetes bacterium]|nr:6-bladed beta-propeller [Bacteroidota bacterium]
MLIGRCSTSVLLTLIGVVVFLGCSAKTDTEELQVIAKHIDLTELFRVGTTESDNAVLFGDIMSIGVNSNDQLLVADSDANVIYVFSKNGNSLRTFGRSGLGPGEFESIRDMDIGLGDSVFVWDGRRSRLLVFEPETFQFSHDIDVETGDDYRTAGGLISISNNQLLMRFTSYYSLFNSDEDQTFDTIQKVSRNGDPVGKPLLEMPVTRHLLFRTESGMGLVLLPFIRHSLAKPDPDGTFYYGWSDSINFGVYSSSGDLLRRIRYPHKALPVTQQELDEHIQSMSEEARQVFHREGDVPKTKPAYSTFTVSDVGQIWLKYTQTSDSLDASWTVIDLDGQPVFSFELPPDVNVQVVKENRVYAIAELEDGAPYVVVYVYD